jgi:WD40 repeat protein
VNIPAARSIEHGGAVTHVLLDNDGRTLLTASDEGRSIRIWSLQTDPPRIVRTLTGPERTEFRFDPSGSRLASKTLLWDLTAASGVEPLRVPGCHWALAFDPQSRWFATAGGTFCRQLSLWPLTRQYPRVFAGHTKRVYRPAFTPDGRHLVSSSLDGSVRVWPLDGSAEERPRILHRAEGAFQDFNHLAMAPDGSFVAAANYAGRVVVLPLDGGPPRELGGFSDMILAVAVGPEARLVAAGAGAVNQEEALVRVWDLKAGDVRILDAGDGKAIRWPLRFNLEGELWVPSGEKLRRWDVAGATPRILDEIDLSRPESRGSGIEDLAWDGSKVLLYDDRAGRGPTRPLRLLIQNLRTHVTRELAWVDEGVGCSATFDATGRLVLSRNVRGVVGLASSSGGESHLFLGHEGPIESAAVSPDERWIATGGEDGTIRLWPMPDLSKPPLHTLPREELLAKLKSLTNLRAVRDAGSPTGWKIEANSFPGWKEIPTW